MSKEHFYLASAMTRAEVDQFDGTSVIDFGTNWCGHCQAAQALVDTALAEHPQLRHLKIEDGKGRALGRSFQVKLWPTLIFLQHGIEVARVVRPLDVSTVRVALTKLLE
jgi:thioredoxin 1